MVTVSKDSPAGDESKTAGNEFLRGYRPELDAVRFLAFLLVFLHHLSRPVRGGEPFMFSLGSANGWRVKLSLMESSAMGLCLFFTLSAYLITSLLLRERETKNQISVRKFYIRRILRIWPLYFFGIGIGVLIGLLLHDKRDELAVLFFLLFAGNFYAPVYGLIRNPMHPLWSISIEEQFYLVWPWAIRWLSRRGLLICALVFVLAANLTLFILGQRHVETESIIWPNTFVQFEMFAAGILLALAAKPAASANAWRGLLLAITGPVLWFIACYQFNAKQPAEAGRAISGLSLMIGYALIAIGCVAILHGFCLFDSSQIPKWAAGMGKISYGLYVFHNLCIECARAIVPVHNLVSYVASALLGLVFTISAAVISYTYLESPFLRLKRKFEVLHTRPI